MMSHAASGGRGCFPMTVSYGFLALPLAFAGIPLYIHIPDFYTRDMGLSIAGAGIVLMVLRLADVVQDPVIGYISDRRPRAQRRVMAFGVVALLAGMGALLSGPPDTVPAGLWLGVTAGLSALGLSMVNINLVAAGGRWTANEVLRGRASGMREGMSLAGMLLASILPGILMLSMSRDSAFETYYFFFAVLLAAGALSFAAFYRNLPADSPLLSSSGGDGRAPLPWRFLVRNGPFLCACFLTQLAAAFPAVLFLYFVTDFLGADGKAGLFLFLYFLSGVTVMPVWIRLAARYGAGRSWFCGMVLAIGTFAWAFFLGEGDLVQFAVICILSGASLGADLALPPVMLARQLDGQGGAAYATQAYAILNLIPKIALALGTGCAFLVLARAGFTPSGVNATDALRTLAVLYALVPCFIKALSALIVFNLCKGDTHDIQKRSSADGDAYGA